MFAAASLGFGSCNKAFLETEPTERISDNQLEKLSEQDPSILSGYMNGIYTKMYEVGSGGTTGHDDFGQKGYDIYSDLLTSDMALSGGYYGWYLNIANLTATVTYTVNQAYAPWRYYYSVIYAANTVIATLGGNDAVPESAVGKHMMGQAKAMRAYGYFYLANLYSREGYGTGNERILPIYTEIGEANSPKSTAKDVYDVIIKDLSEAVSLLDGFNRGNAIHAVDQYVAKGLLAYALAARGTNADLQEVVTLTNDVIANSGKTVTAADEVVGIPATDSNGDLIYTDPYGSYAVSNPESGFNNVNSKSWLWGVDLTLASDLDLVSWWGQVDYFTYSYASGGDGKVIDDGLYSLIHDNDVRKGQFDYTVFDDNLWPINKFFHPERILDHQRNIVTDYVYMRLDEMVLLNAEAHARLNNDVPARTSLKLLLEERFEDPADYAYVDGLSGQALRDEIYLQTRIELWGEGKVYLAMKRNKQSVTRGTNHLFHRGLTFDYNDARLTFLIPQAEELNNPNLDK